MRTNIILASSSPYRANMLAQLGLVFSTCSPDIDETSRLNEGPEALACRLSLEKAQKVQSIHPDKIIIASDQVAYCEAISQSLQKPGTLAKAKQQLRLMQGHCVSFYTGLCVLAPDKGDFAIQTALDTYRVYMRQLSASEIDHYVETEQAIDCAGAFKVEGLGISLFERLEGDDYNSLIGLPLIKLCQFLRNIGHSPLAKKPIGDHNSSSNAR